MMLRNLCLVLGYVAVVRGDVYMHNPRGSNDRNCEKNVNRNNGNRLFDSQNNAKGGYACGRAVGGNQVVTQKMAFYADSILPVQWTQQHGCGQDPTNPGKENVDCQIIIQYACQDTLDPGQRYGTTLNLGGAAGTAVYAGAPRDGIPANANDAATDRIPADINSAQLSDNNNRNQRLSFGMHENLAYYQDCNRRERNKGLFTADQNVNRRDATGTRQNPNGGRRGLECPEERDYYPYWHPTPWKDAAVLVADPKQCAQFQAQSQNVKAYGHCKQATNADGTQVQAPTPGAARNLYNNRQFPNNPAGCAQAGMQWVEEKYFIGSGITANIGAPDCQVAAYSRSNHLGNAATGTVDNLKAFAASVSGAAGSTTAANINGDAALVTGQGAGGQQDNQLTASTYNWKIPSVGAVKQDCVLRLRYNMSSTEVNSRNLTSADNTNGQQTGAIQQDPYVKIAGNQFSYVGLNVNTNQYGRTFQDRSYVFQILPKQNGITGELYNLNYVGKRGNIVQTYPSVEYDFVPNDLVLKPGDAVHFQFLGSDYNPRRGCNDGTGGPRDGNANNNARADRMNVLLVDDARRNMPNAFNQAKVPATMFNDAQRVNLAFAGINPKEDPQCKTQQQLNAINNENARENDDGNCAFLNRAKTPYFNQGPIIVPAAETEKDIRFFSTRNNNFSNRDTKGVIKIRKAVPTAGTTQGMAGPTAYTKPAFDASKFVALSNDLGDDDSELLAVQMIENDGNYNPLAQAKCN